MIDFWNLEYYSLWFYEIMVMLLDFHLTLLNFVIRWPDITMKPHFVTEAENKFVLQKFYNNLELK